MKRTNIKKFNDNSNAPWPPSHRPRPLRGEWIFGDLEEKRPQYGGKTQNNRIFIKLVFFRIRLYKNMFFCVLVCNRQLFGLDCFNSKFIEGVPEFSEIYGMGAWFYGGGARISESSRTPLVKSCFCISPFYTAPPVKGDMQTFLLRDTQSSARNLHRCTWFHDGGALIHTSPSWICQNSRRGSVNSGTPMVNFELKKSNPKSWR